MSNKNRRGEENFARRLRRGRGGRVLERGRYQNWSGDFDEGLREVYDVLRGLALKAGVSEDEIGEFDSYFERNGSAHWLDVYRSRLEVVIELSRRFEGHF